MLLARFARATNNSSDTDNFYVRVISDFPDRNNNDGNHRILYLTVTGDDGAVLLNNNLGADCCVIVNLLFYLVLQSTAFSDFHA